MNDEQRGLSAFGAQPEESTQAEDPRSSSAAPRRSCSSHSSMS
jgi:hypothetical protein